jgi:hypothetical protein
MTLALALSLALAAPPAPSAAVTSDDPPVQVWLNQDNHFVRGDRAKVYVKAAADGYLVVLRGDADGHVRVLFPLDPTDDAFIRGRKKLEVRGRGDREAFTVDEREGSGVVLVAWSASPFKFDEFVRGDHWDYRVLATERADSDAEAALLDIVQRMTGDGFDYDVVTYTVESSTASYRRYHYDRYYPSFRFGFGYGFFGRSCYDPFFYDAFYCGPYYGGFRSAFFYDPFFQRPFFYRPYVVRRYYSYRYRPGYVGLPGGFVFKNRRSATAVGPRVYTPGHGPGARGVLLSETTRELNRRSADVRSERVSSLPERRSGERVLTLPDRRGGERVLTLPDRRGGERVMSLPERRNGERVSTLPDRRGGERVMSLPERRDDERVSSLPERRGGERVSSRPERRPEPRSVGGSDGRTARAPVMRERGGSTRSAGGGRAWTGSSRGVSGGGRVAPANGGGRRRP